MAVAAPQPTQDPGRRGRDGSSLEPIGRSPGAGIPNTAEPAWPSWPIGLRSGAELATACNGHCVKLRAGASPGLGTSCASSCVARPGPPSFTGLGRRWWPTLTSPWPAGGGSDRPRRSPVSPGEAIDCPAPARSCQKIFLSYENCPRPGTRTRTMAPFRGSQGEGSLLHGF